MGVITQADKNLDEVRKHVRKAISAISANVTGEDWGWDDYSLEGKKNQQRILLLLLEVRDRLS